MTSKEAACSCTFLLMFLYLLLAVSQTYSVRMPFLVV